MSAWASIFVNNKSLRTRNKTVPPEHVSDIAGASFCFVLCSPTYRTILHYSRIRVTHPQGGKRRIYKESYKVI